MPLRRKKVIKVTKLKSGQWSITRDDKTVAIFETKEEAIENANKLSKKVIVRE